MSLLNTLIAFAVALGVLIVVHEFGHYLVARLCGVKVLRFQVGFGRSVWLKRAGADQTEWSLGAFPLGGYVKMLDEREGPVRAEERHRAFNRQTVGKRFAIVIAGPVANFFLAIALYWALFIIGVPGIKPVLEAPIANSPAAQAGFTAGERLTRIDDDPVTTWQDVRWLLLDAATQGKRVRVDTQDGKGYLSSRMLDLNSLRAEDLDGNFLDKLGLQLRMPVIAPIVGKVIDGGAADQAGLRAGDEVTDVNGRPIHDWTTFFNMIRASGGAVLNTTVRRGGEQLLLTITPKPIDEDGTRIFRVGAQAQEDPAAIESMQIVVRHNPLRALGEATMQTWKMAVFSLKMLGKMALGEISWKNLSGPITIADYAGQSAKAGALPYVTFLALVSISLGVLNLLPIPLLDGGHLMYYIIEVIKGGPVSERVMEIGQQIGMAILLGLMLFAFYNDINRLVSG